MEDLSSKQFWPYLMHLADTLDDFLLVNEMSVSASMTEIFVDFKNPQRLSLSEMEVLTFPQCNTQVEREKNSKSM